MCIRDSIKPLNEGSSFDVYICNKNNLLKNLKKMKNYSEILVEEFIPGREIQAAITGKKKLGAIELKPKRKFYDYKAKYNLSAKTEHIMPAKINSKKYNELMKIALKAHNLLFCRGITRSDFKFYKNKFYLLEVNTQPGMTNLSLVPEIAAYKGMNFKSLINWIIKDASKVLGCSMTKVRQFIKYEFLDTFKIGQKIMITSESLKRLIENNLR